MRRLIVLVALAACGGDDAPPPQSRPAGGPAPVAGGPGQKDTKDKLSPRHHVEDQVTCAVLDKPTGPECKPENAACDPGLYCLQSAAGPYSCEACPERDSIRHDFKDRDFVAEQIRDPFQSYILIQGDLGKGNEPKQERTIDCRRQDQFVATNYSFQDLKLVGIVTQGTQRKVLMMDSGNYGHIIKRGDCVGKEKALVKDIGTGYITFTVHPDPNDNVRRAEGETSVQLHAGGLQLPTSQPDPGPPTGGPVVAPPSPIVAPPAPPAPVVPAPPAPVVQVPAHVVPPPAPKK